MRNLCHILRLEDSGNYLPIADAVDAFHILKLAGFKISEIKQIFIRCSPGVANPTIKDTPLALTISEWEQIIKCFRIQHTK